MKYLAIVVYCLVAEAAAREQKPYHLYFAEYIEEPSFPDANIMNAQPLLPGPLGNHILPNGWMPNFVPFDSVPTQPFMASVPFNNFVPYQLGSPFNNFPLQPPIPYDSVSLFGNLPPEPYGFSVPYQAITTEQFSVPMPPNKGPVPKIGMTFPRPEAITEELRLPPSFNKFLPEKVGRTYPLTHFATETYNAPVGYGYELGRMEPIIVQSSPTLSILANLWNKK